MNLTLITSRLQILGLQFLGLAFVIFVYITILSQVELKTPFLDDILIQIPVGRVNSLVILATIICIVLYLFRGEISYKNNLEYSSKIKNFFYGLILGVFLLSFTSWSKLAYSYSERIRFDVYFLYGTIVSFLLIKKIPDLISKLIIMGLAMIILSFICYTKGESLFTDDHPSVMYRLHLLSNYFPHVPVYNTFWNAGVDWRDFFATGILNVYLLFLPLIKLLGTIEAYRFIVPSLLFIIYPLVMITGAKLLGLSKLGIYLSVFLGITSNITLYKWALNFGSMGFVCSTILVPLAFCSLLSIIEARTISAKRLIFSGALCTLSCFWSLQALTLIPIILIFTFSLYKQILSSKKLIAITLFFILINATWGAIFIKVSKVNSFLSVEKSKTFEVNQEVGFSRTYLRYGAQKFNFNKPYLIFKENLIKVSPIVVAFSFISLIFCPFNKLKKVCFGATVLWLVTIGLIGPLFKPQLELDRFLLVSCILCCFPIAALLEKILCSKENNVFSTAVFSGFIITSSLSFSSVFQNRGWDTFTLLPKELSQLALAIKNNTGAGRALFSGFILHDLGGGHLGPVAQLAETPLVGSSPVHNLWRYTDVIPKSYREKGQQGIEEYLDLMNITLTIAHEKQWKVYFRDNPLIYNEITKVGKFSIFKRATNSNYFLEGTGEIILQDENQVSLRLNTSEAVIKYYYYSFLQVDGCNIIEGFEKYDSLKLIKLSNCKLDQTITIKSPNPLKRLLF